MCHNFREIRKLLKLCFYLNRNSFVGDRELRDEEAARIVDRGHDAHNDENFQHCLSIEELGGEPSHGGQTKARAPIDDSVVAHCRVIHLGKN